MIPVRACIPNSRSGSSTLFQTLKMRLPPVPRTWGPGIYGSHDNISHLLARAEQVPQKNSLKGRDPVTPAQETKCRDSRELSKSGIRNSAEASSLPTHR